MAIDIKRNTRLAEFTTFKIGGNADHFVVVRSEKELIDALNFAEANSLEVFILGGGSNVVISDSGFDGMVIKLDLKGISVEPRSGSDEVYLTAGAGEVWDEFVEYCVENDLAGVECLSGIPGSLGGTPIQNVGAYGQEVSSTITQVMCYDRTEKQFVILRNEDCEFSYRKSIFNTTQRHRYIVTGVTFRLVKNGSPALTYTELIKKLESGNTSLRDIRNAVLEIRRGKSMVIDDSDINTQSAGSFFKNPVIAEPYFQGLSERFGGNVPSFPAGIGMVKIPAAWLIENAGFSKGLKNGNVGISANHSLALINLGGAGANELVEFKLVIQRVVKEKFGIELTPEPVFVGTFPNLSE